MKTMYSISALHFTAFLLLTAAASVSAFSFPSIPHDNPWLPFAKLAGCHHGQDAPGLGDLKRYLCHFGYLPDSSNFTDSFDDLMEEAIRTYQRNLGLDVTGDLDVSTIEAMMTPRCGVADVAVNGTSAPNASALHGRNLYTYFPTNPTWPRSRRELKYAITATSAVSIDPSVLRTVFARAFARWSAATRLTFTEVALASDADITIGFYSGEHGDVEPFDGVLGTLGHAFAPTDGRFHLDASESWVADGDVTAGGDGAVDLESVAVHEIGHLLGLGHSSAASAIMYPTLKTRTRKVELASDDVEGIQSLYGSNPNYKGPAPTAPATTMSSPETNAAVGVGRTMARSWVSLVGWSLTVVLVGYL